MATTYQEYTGNASTTTFSYPFPVLKTEDIKVALNGVTQTTGYTATTSPAQVVFSSAPASGVVVRVYRDTDVDSAKGVFAAGSSIRAADLNNNQDQVLYALQEEQNQKGIFEEIKLDDDVKIKLGNTAGDAQIWYSGNTLNIDSNKGIILETGNAAFTVSNNGTAKLGYNFLGGFCEGDWFPLTTNDHDLGTSNFQWKDIYIDGTAYLDTANIDTVDINGGAIDGTPIGANSASTGTFSVLNVTTGQTTLGTESDDYVNINGKVNTNITPNSTWPGSQKYLGTTGHPWSIKAGTIAAQGYITTDGTLTANEVSLADSKKITFGTGDDTEVYDTGTAFNIDAGGSIVLDTHNGAFTVSCQGTPKLGWASLAGGVFVGEDLVPFGTSGQYDLGKSNLQWKDLYVDGIGYIDTLNADSLTGSCIVDSGTSTSNSEVYSAKRAGEIFYEKGTLDDITSGNAWVGDDNKLATTAAIDARIVDLIDDVGGFVPIANETSFPNANPDINNGAGTLVSVPLANTLTSDGNGNISINNGTLGNSTVVIANAGDTKTYAQGFGIIVETTTTLNTYNFHRYVPKATEVTTVAGSIANVNTVAGITSNLATVAGISGNVTTVAGIASNVTTVAGVAANVTTVAGNSSNITTVAGDTTAINNITSNLSAVQGAATNATNAASSATAAASSATSAATSATTATTQATTATTQASTATTQATNAASSATSAASSATTATSQASTATTQASNASTSAANALAYKNLALTYRNDSNGILTQVESAPYNLADSASTHTAWGNITDTGANAVFANETSNTLLTMSEGSSSYNYGSIT